MIQICDHTDTTDAFKYVLEKTIFTSAEFTRRAESCVRTPGIFELTDRCDHYYMETGSR